MPPADPFTRALVFVLKLEGGFVNNPADRGGPTNRGITQNTYDAWQTEQANPTYRKVEYIDEAEVHSIYFQKYWTPGNCSGLAWPVDFVHFDGCVNHGPDTAGVLLQKSINEFITKQEGDLIHVDGKVGPITLSAAKSAGVFGLFNEVLWMRLEFYRRLVDRDASQLQFLRNWIRRLEKVREEGSR